jgi:hypothetical protein
MLPNVDDKVFIGLQKTGLLIDNQFNMKHIKVKLTDIFSNKNVK